VGSQCKTSCRHTHSCSLTHTHTHRMLCDHKSRLQSQAVTQSDSCSNLQVGMVGVWGPSYVSEACRGCMSTRRGTTAHVQTSGVMLSCAVVLPQLKSVSSACLPPCFPAQSSSQLQQQHGLTASPVTHTWHGTGSDAAASLIVSCGLGSTPLTKLREQGCPIA
jgi:hypothetical protein